MYLIITRHGETLENKKGLFLGQLPGSLSSKGIRQAKKLALRLSNHQIDFIYSSDLARAIETTNEIAKYHPGALISYVEELREQHLGDYQGSRIKDILRDSHHTKWSLQPINGETLQKLFSRAKQFMTFLLSNHTNDTVLIVGHNGINKALITTTTCNNFEDMLNLENQRNTSVNIFKVFTNGSYKRITSNCLKHLSK